MNILTEKLRNLVKELKNEGKTELVIMNALKEHLHYGVLDFVYNNSVYSRLVMYGGTLLHIGYGLSRMSEDLDFQTDKKFDFEKFRSDIIAHFKNIHRVDIDVTTPQGSSEKSTETRFIRFPFLKELGLDHPRTVLRIRFDVNYFPGMSDFTKERIPITKDTYAFSIKTYPLSTLMASKVAAVLLRTKRGIGDEISDCKPRDIYDLMWYMGQKIMPNLEYIKAKGIRAGNPLELFDAFTHRVANLDDNLFKDDLAQFFYNPLEYDDWHRNWRDRFLKLRNAYEIYRVKNIQSVLMAKEFSTDNRSFRYIFSTDQPGKTVQFTFVLSEYWYIFSDFRISGYRRKDLVVNIPNLTEYDYEYLGLFYTKIENYLKRNDFIVLQPELKTKIIRATGENLNVKTQVLLDRRLLEKINFENLL